MIRFGMKLNGPFDPRLSLAFWLRHPMEIVDLVENGDYSSLFFIEERPALLRVHVEGTVEDPRCEVTLGGEALDGDRKWAKETARWILNDEAPLEEFYAHVAAADQDLALLTRRFRGLRFPLSPTLFETLVFAIVGQQVNVAFAYRCKAALEEAYARRATVDGREYFAGLAPGDLRGAEMADLRAKKISNAKSRAILELAAAFREQPLDRFSFSGFSVEEIRSTLTAFRGIGPWTAEYALVRALGRLDVLPGGDIGLQNSLKRFYRLEARPSEEQVRAIGARWRPYGALATLYLWTGLIHDERLKNCS